MSECEELRWASTVIRFYQRKADVLRALAKDLEAERDEHKRMFNVANDAILAIPYPEIRVTRLSFLRQGGDVNLACAGRLGDLLQQCLQAGVETFLPRVPLAVDLGDCLEVVLQDSFHPLTLRFGYHLLRPIATGQPLSSAEQTYERAVPVSIGNGSATALLRRALS